MPNIADLLTGLDGANVFSKLDLLKGYFQVPVNPDDVPKTAIITPFGTYVFHYSTFGLKNSGATFQRMMDNIFGDTPFVLVYVDDILVFSKNHRDHQHHLRQTLELLRENGLVARADKSVIGASSVEFLGYQIDPTGVSPIPSKVSAVNNFTEPTTRRALQEYLGMLNYYHCFVKGAADDQSI